MKWFKRREDWPRVEAYDRGFADGTDAEHKATVKHVAQLEAELLRAREFGQRWFNEALKRTDAQRQRTAEMAERGSVGTHPLWDIPNGSVLAYNLGPGGATFIEIIEPEPTGRFVIDMGVRPDRDLAEDVRVP